MIRALVADDFGVIRTLIRKAFEELGVENVDVACDGAEALQLAKDVEYQLVVLDWHMPHMNGIDVARELRAMGLTCPIIMQTTANKRSDVMEALKAGVTDYLLKPFTIQTVKAKLTKHVEHVAASS